MALIVEDGTIVPGANSYVSLAEADAYIANSLSPTVWAALPIADRERLLIASTRWLDQRTKWAGYKLTSTQSLRWPRGGTYDCDDLPVAEDIVPQPVKDVVMELANFLTNPDNDPTRYSGQTGFSELTVDVITLKFQSGFDPNTTKFLPGINDILCNLGRVATANGRGYAPIQRV